MQIEITQSTKKLPPELNETLKVSQSVLATKPSKITTHIEQSPAHS